MRRRPALFDLVRAQVVVHLTSVRTGVPYPHSTVVEPEEMTVVEQGSATRIPLLDSADSGEPAESIRQRSFVSKN